MGLGLLAPVGFGKVGAALVLTVVSIPMGWSAGVSPMTRILSGPKTALLAAWGTQTVGFCPSSEPAVTSTLPCSSPELGESLEGSGHQPATQSLPP